MPLPFSRHIGEWAYRIVISPAGPVGWPASFPRFRVGGAPGLLATATAKIELDHIRTDERERQTYGNGERYFLRNLRNYYG